MNRKSSIEEPTRFQGVSQRPWEASNAEKAHAFDLVDVVLFGLFVAVACACFLSYLMSASGGDVHRMKLVVNRDLQAVQLAGVMLVMGSMAHGVMASLRGSAGGSSGYGIYRTVMGGGFWLVVLLVAPALLGV